MSNRSLADMDFFENSATRQKETNENIKKQDNDNDNKTLKQHNNNVNDNVNVNVDKKKTDTNNNEPPQIPNEKKEGNTNNTVPKDPPPEDNKQDEILDFLNVDQEKKVVGFHLDKDVRQAFQKILGKKPKRGDQSELANRIFRDFFEKRGLL